MMGDLFSTILYLVHYCLLLAFGILLSAAFAGIRESRKNLCILFATFAGCGIVQLITLLAFGEIVVWLIYPLIAHIPLVLLLFLHYKKTFVSSLACVATAYLCCQPAKWFGVAALAITNNANAELFVRIIVLLATGFIFVVYASRSVSSLFGKDSRSVLIFSSIPLIYYLFDYTMSVYTGYWDVHPNVVSEFIPFVMSVTYMAFCVYYYQAYEQRTESEQREQITRMVIEQQRLEFEVIKRTEQEIKILRHDLRHLLNGISICLDKGDVETAKSLLASYAEDVEDTKVVRWCENDLLNYILSDFSSRCQNAGLKLEAQVGVKDLPVDDMTFVSILSNALENALNAQKGQAGGVTIKVAIKVANGRLLLSVRNPCSEAPTFVDGIPISKRSGHGYGAQSILLMTERLGGKCQFTVENGEFVTRVAISL